VDSKDIIIISTSSSLRDSNIAGPARTLRIMSTIQSHAHPESVSEKPEQRLENLNIVRISPERTNILSDAAHAAKPNTTLVLAPGQYIQNQTVSISSRGLKVMADTKGTAKICFVGPSEMPVFQLDGRDIFLHDLEIEDCRLAAHESYPHVGIMITANCNVQIEGCKISVKHGTAIKAMAACTPSIEKCIIHSSVR